MTATANTTTTGSNNTIMGMKTSTQGVSTLASAPAVDQDKGSPIGEAVLPTNAAPTASTTQKDAVAVDGTILRPGEVADADSEAEDSDTTLPSIPFSPTQCLFCPVASQSFELNQTHMHKHHGLFLPLTIDDGARELAVEMETMVQYMHMVIFGYHECLFCGTQRQSTHAVQQHMMGRGHCRINLDESDEEEEENEFRDFYEIVDVEEEHEEGVSEGESSEDESASAGKTTQAGKRAVTPSKLDDNTLRLSSGKILSHRSTPPPSKANRRPLTEPKGHGHRAHDPLLEDLLPPPGPGPEPSTSSPKDPARPGGSEPSSAAAAAAVTLTRTERRALAHHKSALGAAVSKMSGRDRAALAHLSPAEQRAVIVRQFKQQDRLSQAERKYRGKIDPRPTKARGGQRNEDCVLGDLGVAFWG